MADGAKLIARHDQLKAIREPWLSLWREVAPLVLPRQDDFFKSRSQADKRTAQQFDARAARALEKFVAVLNAMLRQVIHDGLADEAYIAARTVGWEGVRATVEPYTPEMAERIAGVPAERIVAAARLYGRSATSLIMHARGIEHSTHGVNNVLACINLALSRGQVGKPGGGTIMRFTIPDPKA